MAREASVMKKASQQQSSRLKRETATSRAASPVAGPSPGGGSGGGGGVKQLAPPSAAELAAMRQVELKNLNKQARRLESKQRAEERLRQVRRRCALMQNGCPVLDIQFMRDARIHTRTIMYWCCLIRCRFSVDLNAAAAFVYSAWMREKCAQCEL